MKNKNKSPKIVILGAGITGLVAGYYLSKNHQVVLLEKQDFLGGTAASFKHKEFILDYGPHKIYTELPGILDEIKKITPLIKQEKKNSIFLKDNYFDFPLKLTQIALKMPFTAFLAGLDILFKPFSQKSDDSYENYLLNRFGRTMYNLSFRDYAFKVWKTNPKELDKELAKRRVAISSISELIKGILFKDTKKISAEYFYYPPMGMNQLIASLKDSIESNNGQIITNAKIQEIKEKNNYSIKVNNKLLAADIIISTIPLDSLAELLDIPLQDIKYQKLNIHYFILNKQRAFKDSWIFFPEKKITFQRVSEQKAFSQFTSPLNNTCIMVETTKELSSENTARIIEELESVGILKKKEILEHFTKTLEKAYPVYKKGFLKSYNAVAKLIENKKGFYLLGRQGLFNYNNIDQCWDMALKIKNQIDQNKTKIEWQKTKKYFDSYRIVD
jgi:protoporphyrinogen oxidase